MQQGKHSSVNNSRPVGEEVTGTRKKGVTEILEKRKREVKVLFKGEHLKVPYNALTQYCKLFSDIYITLEDSMLKQLAIFFH